jgi:hypothetical protein
MSSLGGFAHFSWTECSSVREIIRVDPPQWKQAEMSLRRVLLFVLPALAWTPLAQPAAARPDLTIHEVFVLSDAEPPQIQILGKDFDHGPGPLSVHLGEIAERGITGSCGFNGSIPT